MAMLRLPETLKKLATRMILMEGLHPNTRRYIYRSQYHHYEDTFIYHHDHSIPPFLPNCMFGLLCTTSFTTTFTKTDGPPLHTTSTKHTCTASVSSEQKSWLGGQYHNPQKQCPEVLQDCNDDVQTIFTIINNHPSSEPGMGQALRRSGVVFSNELVEKVLERLRFSHSSGLKALEFFYWVGHQLGRCHTSEAYNTMLFILARMRRFDRVWALMWEMHRRDPSLITSKTMQIVLARFAKPDKARLILKQMREHSCYPDAAAYNAVINNFCRAHRLADAYKLLEEMMSSGVQPNPNTYNIFFRYYYRSREWKDAWKLYLRMIGAGCLPNTQTCLLLMKMFCSQEQLDMALGLWSDMLQKGCGSYTLVFDVLMDVLCDNGKLDEAERCFLELLDKGQKPSLTSYKRLNVLLELAKKHDVILELSEKMKNFKCW